MKLSLFALSALAAATVLLDTPPWCAQYGATPSAPTNCGFVTFEQCLATISGIDGFCVRNNTYQPPPGRAGMACLEIVASEAHQERRTYLTREFDPDPLALLVSADEVIGV